MLRRENNLAGENKICNDCDKSVVCQWVKIIDKFDEEVVKNPIQATIEIKECPEYLNVDVVKENIQDVEYKD